MACRKRPSGYSIKATHAFGLNSSLGSCPVVPLFLENMTHVCCVGSMLAFVAADKSGSIKLPMQFFPGLPSLSVCKVTALAFHAQRKLLAVCVVPTNPDKGRCSCVVFSIGICKGYNMPSLMAKLANTSASWQDDVYSKAAFSTDSTCLVCVTGPPSNLAIGYDWQTERIAFTASMCTEIRTLAYHPRDSLELSTSGSQHLQLWRLLRKRQLKARPKIGGCHFSGAEDGSADFTLHVWLDNELLVAGTRDGSIVIIRDNEEAQRFNQIHPGANTAVRALAPLEGGFTSMCEDGIACIFVQSQDKDGKAVGGHVGSTIKKKPILVRLARRVKLDGVESLFASAIFPQSTTALLCCRDGLASLDLATLLLITTGPDLQSLPVARVGVPFHNAPIISLASAQSKPVFASCSFDEIRGGNNVWLWDLRAKSLAARYTSSSNGIEKKRFVSIDLHPCGQQLIAGCEDEVFLYNVAYKELMLAQAFQVRGVVKLKNDATPLVATTELTLVKYSPSGLLFAAVMGRLVEIFATIAPGEAGRAGLIHCLRGHAGNIQSLAWASDDRKIWTASEDGAVYQWAVGDATQMGKLVMRTDEFVRLDVVWGHLTAFGDGGLVAAGCTRPKTDQEASLHPLSTAETPHSRVVVHSDQNFDHEQSHAVLTIWRAHKFEAHCAIEHNLSENTRICSTAAIDERDGVEALLLVGTNNGSVLVYLWCQIRMATDGLTPPAQEVSLCGGPVRMIATSCHGNQLCVTSDDGSLIVCTASGDVFLRSGGMASLIEGQGENCELYEGICNDDALDMVSIERRALLCLEEKIANLTSQLEQSMLEAQKSTNEAVLSYKQELQEVKCHYEAQIRLRDADIHTAQDSLRKARGEHEAQLDDVKVRFDAALEELEILYDRKLAIEAARYMEIQDERDRTAQDAREQLERHQEHAKESLEKMRRENKHGMGGNKDEIRLLKGYLEHTKRQFNSFMEEQDKLHDVQLIQLQESNANALAEASKARHNISRDNARIKRDNMELKEECHKNRDELSQCQHELSAEQEKCIQQNITIEEQQQELKTQRKRADHWEYAATQQGEKLKELERMRTVLSQEKVILNSTICEKKNELEEKNEFVKRMDAVMQEAGMQNKALGENLRSKAVELRRVKTMLKECRSHIFSKNKSLSLVSERIDALLQNFKDPDLRSDKSFAREMESIRDFVDKMQASTPKDVKIVAPEQHKTTPHRNAQLLPRTIRVNLPGEHQNRTCASLRKHNSELMEELNELRFDRLSLRRKLRDAQLATLGTTRPPSR